MGAPSNSSSSGDEDGDAEWKAAIDSVAAVASHFSSNGFSASDNSRNKSHPTSKPQNGDEDDLYHRPPTQKLKHYQIKAQKVLDDILEKNIELVKNPTDVLDDKPLENEGGVQLFRKAPPGIVFDHKDEFRGPTKRPRIVPGTEIDEKSKEFKRRLQSVAVNGFDIMVAAKNGCQKSQARLEAKDASAKAAAKKEEERVAKLKKIRGERWLPCIARGMSLKFRS